LSKGGVFRGLVKRLFTKGERAKEVYVPVIKELPDPVIRQPASSRSQVDRMQANKKNKARRRRKLALLSKRKNRA